MNRQPAGLLVLVVLAATASITGCTVPPEKPTTPTERLAMLTIRTGPPPPVPADITTAFGISGDPAGDQDLSSRCPVRSMVIVGQSRHARGDTGGLCGTPTSGDWSPLFGGPIVHDPAALDIGFVVPLTEAWRSGAGDPSFYSLRHFATDESWERVVITVGSDQARGDRAPDAWEPDPAARCGYAIAWTNAKWAWHLSVTHAEHDALAAMIGTCPPAPSTSP